jgi:hypothetical protein
VNGTSFAARSAGAAAIKFVVTCVHGVVTCMHGTVTAERRAYLDALEAQGITPQAGRGRLRLWGLKFVLDGGVEAAALSEPYADL